MSQGDRERHMFEQARRSPVFFCVQYFFTLLGVYTLLEYIVNSLLARPDTSSVLREAVTAAIAAILVTLFVRSRFGRPPASSSPA